MKAAIFGGPRDLVVGERPDPVVKDPRTRSSASPSRACAARTCGTTAACPTRSGCDRPRVHRRRRAGRGATSATSPPATSSSTPFTYSDGTCVLCRAGWQSNCLHGGGYGNHGMDGGQGEAVRVPFADATSSRSRARGIPTRCCARSSRSRTSRAPATTPRSAPASARDDRRRRRRRRRRAVGRARGEAPRRGADHRARPETRRGRRSLASSGDGHRRGARRRGDRRPSAR